MKSSAKPIEKISDKFFKSVFGKEENTRVLLKKLLPAEFKKRIDFDSIEIGNTDQISNQFAEFFSDIVVKAKIMSKSGRKIPTDICFILEHKTTAKVRIFIQVQKYMVEEWQKDIDEKKPLRIIIPIVFYHGKRPWNIPHEFIDQFDIDDELKPFLLNYRYFLFDTNSWDMETETDDELKSNVFLLSTIALMKYAYSEDYDGIEAVFRFWHEKGFLEEIENVIYFLLYISETKKLDREQMEKLLEKNRIDGGDIMLTLAETLRNEGRKIGIDEGKKEASIKIARELLNDGFSLENIKKYTGLTEKEIKALMH